MSIPADPEVPALPDLDEVMEHEQGEEDEERPALDIALKERRLLTQPFDFIVGSLEGQIKDGELVLQDDFQRRRVWNDKKASGLVESLLLNVPIPVCYFAELENGAYSVIDGQQRLTSIWRFLTNQFALTGLRVRPEINKKRFVELERADQRLIKTRTVRCIVIQKESHPDIRFDVFQRLNSAAVPLTPQELRNSTFRGAINTLVRDLCKDERFQRIRRVTELDARMRDAEMILRFFAFHYAAPSYRGFFARFLDDYVKSGQTATEQQISEHRALFLDTVEKVEDVFGTDAFRMITVDGVGNQINRAVYDVVMLSFTRLPKEQLAARRSEIVDGLRDLCVQSADFRDAVGGATRDKARVNTRLRLWREKLQSTGLDYPEIRVGD